MSGFDCAPLLSARAQSADEGIIMRMAQAARDLKAKGRDVISLTVGEPDFATPAFIVEAAQRALADPKNYRYTPAVGLPELREAIAEKTRRDSGWAVPASQVIVTNGGKQAVYQAFQVLLDPFNGIVNKAISAITGGDGPGWLTDPNIALLSVVAIDVWKGVGLATLI